MMGKRVVQIGALLGALGLLTTGAAWWRIDTAPAVPARHAEAQRLAVARWVAEATGFGVPAPATEPPCDELRNAAAAWQSRLRALRQSMDLPREVHVDPMAFARAAGGYCRASAVILTRYLVRASALFAARDRWRDGMPAFTPWRGGSTAVARLEPDDAATVNLFAGVPGELFAADGGRVDVAPHDLAAWRYASEAPQYQSLNAALGDADLAGMLIGPALLPAMQPAHGTRRVAGRDVPAGRDFALTIDPVLQAVVVRHVRCFTGVAGACVDAGLPPALAADPRLSDPQSGPRAPAAAIMIVELNSGRVLAASGGMATCQRENLLRDAAPTGASTPVFRRKADRCAQLPDRQHGYLLHQHPISWSVPPGSFTKAVLVAGCMQQGVIGASEMPALRVQLARSDDNDFFKRLALRCAKGMASVWRHYAQPGTGMPGASVPLQVLVAPPDVDDLVVDVMDPTTFGKVQARWRRDPAGTARAIGVKATASYLRSQALASIAIGGGGHQAQILALTNLARDLALRGQGLEAAPVTRIVAPRGGPVPLRRVDLVDVEAARLTAWLLGGVTSPVGTARGACARVFGNCPPDGLPGLWGKTGTSDFSVADGSQIVKPGAAWPAKTFVAVFEAAGRRYVGAAMVLRGRDHSGQLELHGNAAAELVLLAKRALDGGGKR